jgi:hypothetical protein
MPRAVEHLDIGGEYRDEQQDETAPGERPDLRDEDADAARHFREPRDVDDREGVREHVGHDARVGGGADEMQDARPDEEDCDADGRAKRQRVESRKEKVDER